MGGILKLIGSVTAFKVFIGGTFMTILGIILYNLGVEVIDEILQFVLAQINNVEEPDSVSVSLTGFAAWVMIQMRLADCLSFITSIVILKWSLRKIPFIRW